MLFKSFASNGQVIMVGGVDLRRCFFINSFMERWKAETPLVTPNGKVFTEKADHQLQRRCSAVLQLKAALGDTPIRRSIELKYLSRAIRLTKSSLLGSGKASSKVKRLMVTK